MEKTNSFGIWVIGIYLKFGACLPAGMQGIWCFHIYTCRLILKPHLLIGFSCRLRVLILLSRNLLTNGQCDGIDSYKACHF